MIIYTVKLWCMPIRAFYSRIAAKEYLKQAKKYGHMDRDTSNDDVRIQKLKINI